MNLSKINNIYFIGIGGIGMSALARYFKSLGKNIAGYDRTTTSLTSSLIQEGIDIHFEDNINSIDQIYKDPFHTIVVYTPAIPADHTELNYFIENNYQLYKRSEILGLITKESQGIAVAGTHGKTSISAIISHILNQSNYKCNAFLGGISKDHQSNILISNTSNLTIMEADEFDRSFLQLTPYIALITSMDADHLDIYGTREELVSSFNQFIKQIKPGGILVYNEQLEKELERSSIIRRYTYSLDKQADFYAENIKIIERSFEFDLVTPDNTIENIRFGLPGRINVENAVAAAAIANLLGVEDEIIKQSLSTFKGVERRFDYQINTKDLVYIDDYAHHPNELSSTINSIKELYPDKQITGIFQPHLYTRTRDFAKEFAQSLDLLDDIILLDIYPAREEPIEGISSKIIFNLIKNKNKTLSNKSDLLNSIKNKKIDVLLTLGAGDIDQLVEPIKDLLTMR